MKSWSWDTNTQTAGTVITEFAPPVPGRLCRVAGMSYSAGTTVHDLYLMRAIDETEVTVNAAAGATTLSVGKVTFADQTLAAGDYLLIEHGVGTFELNIVASVASLVITLTALAKAVPAGKRVWMFGAIADTSYHLLYKSIASTRIDFNPGSGGLIESGYDTGTYSRDGLGDPVMFYTANPTAAGTLNWGSIVYV